MTIAANPSRRVRVGLVGTGSVAEIHAKVISALPGVELCAVCDTDALKGSRFSDRWGIGAAFASLDEMLAAATPDVVHVLVPPPAHARAAILCMTRGADVFVEKPLCVTEAECCELASAAERTGRRVGVNHNVTFSRPFLELVEAIHQRRLGALEQVTVFWNVPFGMPTLDSPWFSREGPGVAVLETGPHPLSLVVRLLGEATRVSARVLSAHQAFGDTWQIALECERGTAMCFLALGRGFTDTSLHVIGEDGSASVDLGLGYLCLTQNTQSRKSFARVADSMAAAKQTRIWARRNFIAYMRSALGLQGFSDEFSNVMAASIGSFYRARREGAPLPVGLTEGIAVVRGCLGIVASGLPQSWAAAPGVAASH